MEPVTPTAGNQVVRNKGVVNQEQVLAWDAENRLAAVTYTNRTVTGSGGGSLPTTCNGVPCKQVFLPLVMQQTPAERYSYDADGARVRKETKTEVTRYIGSHYEVTVAITNSQVLTTTKYYAFGGQRIAVRQNGALSYLHGDHLGSTSVTTSNSGATTNSVRYYAYGGQRSGNLLALPTDHGFTGQKLDRGAGLMYYGARYYDPALGTFVSPDTIVPSPSDLKSLNRYSYTLNNPLKLIDPSGHRACEATEECQTYDPPSPQNSVGRNIIRNLYKDAYKHYLPRKLIDNYVDEAGSLRLTAQEAIDTNPWLRIQDSQGFAQTFLTLKQGGGGRSSIKTSGPGVALVNGTLGNFTANYEGDISVSNNGQWSFEGQVDFYDYWDFDPKPAGSGRSKVGEVKVRITAAILPGKPFDITSDPLRVAQTSADSYARFIDYPNHTPKPVIDPLTQFFAPLLNLFLR